MSRQLQKNIFASGSIPQTTNPNHHFSENGKNVYPEKKKHTHTHTQHTHTHTCDRPSLSLARRLCAVAGPRALQRRGLLFDGRKGAQDALPQREARRVWQKPEPRKSPLNRVCKNPGNSLGNEHHVQPRLRAFHIN